MCDVNTEINGINLISEVGEISRWPLQNFITGFNLTYSLNESSGHLLNFTQNIQYQFGSTFENDLVLDSSYYIETTGNIILTVLT